MWPRLRYLVLYAANRRIFSACLVSALRLYLFIDFWFGLMVGDSLEFCSWFIAARSLSVLELIGRAEVSASTSPLLMKFRLFKLSLEF